MSIQVLDCTLRDGGYVNDWHFGKSAITAILDKLDAAHLDIVECGFLTQKARGKDYSLYENVKKIESLLPKRERRCMYVAMIAMGEKELHPFSLSDCDKTGIQGIRLTFHQNEIIKAMGWAEILMAKGYKVFMQPVSTVFYTDMELLRLIERINRLKPYAFYIVDTLGSMYRNDVSHCFHLINENMDPEIHIGFHGHNNLQLAFSNAQVLGKIQTKRTLIIDASVYGIGRGAGNLPTELITQYINKNIASQYDVSEIMGIYDEYIAPIREKYAWGYALPYHIAASHICHPNYASYLIDRGTLTVKDIEKIILSIPKEYRPIYDHKLIEGLYTHYQNQAIDDHNAVRKVSRRIGKKKVLILAPGNSLQTKEKRIARFLKEQSPFVISVNFIPPHYPVDACFISNHKRLAGILKQLRRFPEVEAIFTSNLSVDEVWENALFADYARCTNSDPLVGDNAGLMLLAFLCRCGVSQVFLAGFDGFLKTGSQKDHLKEEKEKRMQDQLQYLSSRIDIRFLTRSPYDRNPPSVSSS